jgi:hypothetical protein
MLAPLWVSLIKTDRQVGAVRNSNMGRNRTLNWSVKPWHI